MTKEKRKKKKNKFKMYIIILVIFYLIFRIIPILRATTLKTVTVNYDALEIKENSRGIVFKYEDVYTSKTPGQVTLLAKEGERVSAGSKIASVSLNGNDLFKDIEKIDEDIEKLKEKNISKDLFKGDLEKNDEDIENLANEIRESVLNEDYEKANELKENLREKVDKQLVMSGGNSYNALTIKNLERKKKELLEEISNDVTDYYSKNSGIISYKIDGLENIFTPEKIGDIKLDDFKELDESISEIKDNDSINNEDEMFKVINNFKWYVVLKIDDIEDKTIKEGQNLTLRVKSFEKEMIGRVIDTDIRDKEGIIVVELNSHLHNFYDKRYLDVEVIIKKYSGLLIPRMAIIDKDGVTGVYIKDISGISKFRPIEILGEYKDNVIIKKGDGLRENYIEVDINGQKERVKTLTLYDEVFIHGDKIKEGEIVN